ncbi:sugar phosphate isomerase/epimerase family protein [Nakamurella deserti]|uniref:sugar phosphate isomerase/epimerase family protein n=1 Tax=Nakamurella deserti TaxID=2164074 RepID=UPI000DBE7A76|nr:sugar phosphate isomerase/epimerase family protein [Nakamurella deserti]
MSAPVELLATCWTHSGALPLPGAHLSPYDLRTRAEAVARAGYTGIGVTIDDLEASPLPLADFAVLLDDLGLVHREVELLEDWWATGERRRTSDAVRSRLLVAAEVLGARSIKVGPDVVLDDSPLPPPADVARWAAELHTLAGQAADVGSRIALEPLPFSNVADFRLAGELVRAADHPAAGLTVDIWHVERGPSTLADVAALPAGSVFVVELNDAGTPQGHLFDDTIRRRVLPGDGVFDVAGFVRVLADGGFAGPWGVEMLSDAHRSQPLDEALAAAAAGTRAVFATL